MAAVDRNSLPDGLLEDIKNYLDIAWDDAATDRKVSGIIGRSSIFHSLYFGS